MAGTAKRKAKYANPLIYAGRKAPYLICEGCDAVTDEWVKGSNWEQGGRSTKMFRSDTKSPARLAMWCGKCKKIPWIYFRVNPSEKEVAELYAKAKAKKDKR